MRLDALLMRLGVIRQGSVDLVKDRRKKSLSGNQKFSDLFTKSTDQHRITPKTLVKASNHLTPFQIAPKHQRQSWLNQPSKATLFLQYLLKKFPKIHTKSSLF
jgi:hypothetical protein